MFRRIRHSCAALSAKMVFFALQLPFSACAADAIPQRIDDSAYARAQRLVNIEPGRRLNIYCVGKGSPTAVFDAGMNNWNQIWGLVQPRIATKTRACSYDRAGLGFSDPSNRAGSSANIVDDLHRLLIAASIQPPYILVGHSYGGMNMRLYANLYPDEVVGMVLVDPSHEDQEERFLDLVQEIGLAPPLGPTRELLVKEQKAERDALTKAALACLNAATAGFVKDSETYKACVSTGQNPHYNEAINAVYTQLQQKPSFIKARMSEEESIGHASADQVRAARHDYGDMPLVILTRGPAPLRAKLP